LIQWLIVSVAALGFAFDTYELLMMPLIARPALAELLQVDPNTDSGHKAILAWTGYIMWGSAISGGIFGLLGGYLTDRFGRRRVLMWSIMLYTLSPLGAAFSTSPVQLLILRCTTFIGVCVEFVAAVAWLAELFPNPHQREAVIGYTQAFSSVGGLLVTGAYLLAVNYARYLPMIHESQDAWRYTLISGLIPALPLIILFPFLPESPTWLAKKASGTLKRPSLAQLFGPATRRTALVTAAMFACAFGAAFGALQLTPQIVPGLDPELPKLVGMRIAYEAAQNPIKRKGLEEQLAEAKKDLRNAPTKGKQANVDRIEKQLTMARTARGDPGKLAKMKDQIKGLSEKQESLVGGVQMFQEVGGLAGRFALAWLALRILSRRKLLRIFLVPGLLIIPLVFLFPAAGNLPAEQNIGVLKVGIFFAGFFTIAQFSFWGNYLPRVYPTHLRGTGESFAANVGGRMVGTAFNPLAANLLVPFFLTSLTGVTRPASVAYAAATVAFLVYGLGLLLSFALPEPKGEALED
jgi:MFS family permease